LASKGPRTPDRSGDFDRREWSNVLETEYPNKIHRQWNPLAGQKLKSLIEAAGIAERIDESRDNPAAQLACPDVKGHPALQAHCKRLYADWNGILMLSPKRSIKHRKHIARSIASTKPNFVKTVFP
jgi:hypothetical protein